MIGGSLHLVTYRLAARLARWLPLGGRAGESLAGREASLGQWTRLARREDAVVIWLHAASVGEAMTAEPVMRRLRAAVPTMELVLTCSSPSLASWPRDPGAVAKGFAPPEDPAAMAAAFDAIRPDLVVFSRSDLWPEIVLAAHARRIAVTVIGATVRPASWRLRWPALPFLRRLCREIRFVGATSGGDAERWMRLGVPTGAVSITGDPRHDQVIERVTDLTALRPFRGWADRGPVLVAGSTEQTDEAILCEAFAEVQRAHPAARLLVVPHDPAGAVVDRLHRRAARAGVACETMTPGQTPAAPCVIAAERGRLSDLYALGSMSYVGGGFGTSGVHAVIEPAAYALPVLVGPRFESGSDTARLVKAGGALPVVNPPEAHSLATLWLRLLENEAGRTGVGLAARAVLQQGSAAVTASRLLALLPA